MPQLSVILINYRSGQFLKACLDSLLVHSGIADLEIILVDNSPGDGLWKQLEAHFPQVRYLPMSGNTGFARANNAGLRVALSSVCLLLNTDCVVKPDVPARCLHSLLSDPELAAAGVQLVFPDGRLQISGSNNVPGALNYLITIPFVGDGLRRLFRSLGVSKPGVEKAGHRPVYVDWINGAFLMVKQEAIQKAGLLDEDFFLYHEESEWCSRLRKYGRLCLFGDMQVVHFEGASSAQAFNSSTSAHSNLTDRKGRQLLISMLLRIRKEFGVGWYVLHLLAHSVSLLFVWLLALIVQVAGGTNSLHQAMGYTSNLVWAWRLCLRMLSNKPYFYKML